MSFLKNLPYPNVIEQLSYDEILKNIKSLFKGSLNDDEISLLESDRFSALLETLAYRELLLRARINSAVKSMLLPFAQGADLDNIVAMYGIERLRGERPAASVKFTLSVALSYDVLIPAGLVLASQDGQTAKLKESLQIKAGQTSITGISILDAFVKESAAKCELIQTPLPFVLQAKQEGSFGGGAEVEDDERLRERAVLSLERFSTAGAASAYVYHALTANAKVIEAIALNGGPGIVKVYVKSSDESEAVLESVRTALNDEKVRPLTDTVIVANATKRAVNIKAHLELTDLFLQAEIQNAIDAVQKSLPLGEDLNLSRIYSTLHQNGVYRVGLSSPTADIKADKHEYIVMSFELSFAKANL